MTRKYLSCADTAKLVRKALKESFPGVKFGVRSSSYSGGASISVSWTDGPNIAQVDAVVDVFEGSYFDGSIDYKGSRYALMDGVQVSFGADSVSTSRKYSRAACERVARRFPELKLRSHGSDRGGYWLEGADYETMYWVRQALSKSSDRLSVRKSATAGKVIYLGNDGYSEIGALAIED